MPAVCSYLRQWRQRRRLTQQELAARAGVSRQTISGIEAGLYGPGVEVGLRLAQALDCRIEDLFALADQPVDAEVVGHVPEAQAPLRVALGSVAGRTLARPLTGLGAMCWGGVAAHGIARPADEPGTVRVHRLPGAGPTLFLAGCDPALGLLAAHARRLTRGMDALWWHAANAGAAAQQARREVHGAAIHHHGVTAAPPPAQPVARFRVARWQMGWLLAPGNPKGFHDATDLRRRDIRLANREVGSGARQLLDRLLAEAGITAGGVANC